MKEITRLELKAATQPAVHLFQGDLDMSADSLTTSTVISGSTVYPYGTEELFPMMADTDGNVQSQTAHYYMECSNKVR